VALRPEHRAELAIGVEPVLEPLGVAVSRFQNAGGWSVEALCEQRPHTGAVQRALKALGAPPATIAYVPPKNWVAETQRMLAPLRIGRFFFHGSHFDGRPPRAAISLQIDASLAFGTGRPETTRGCLLALDRLARSGQRFKRALDLGCGSGILALAIVRLWDAPVLAVDTDADAIAIARENLRINRAPDRLRVVKSYGFGAVAVKRAAPFDLIVANILAGPLCRLARGFGRHLAPGGVAILSGLMNDQEPQVIAAQERHGLKLRSRWRSDDWSVLEFRRLAERKRRPLRRGRRHSA